MSKIFRLSHPGVVREINACNRCGHDDPDNRHGAHFRCLKCGYQVHADVNASINIAKKGEWVINQPKKEKENITGTGN